jgi:hypothetical protein
MSLGDLIRRGRRLAGQRKAALRRPVVQFIIPNGHDLYPNAPRARAMPGLEMHVYNRDGSCSYPGCEGHAREAADWPPEETDDVGDAPPEWDQ